jgi:hypothetical protein
MADDIVHDHLNSIIMDGEAHFAAISTTRECENFIRGTCSPCPRVALSSRSSRMSCGRTKCSLRSRGPLTHLQLRRPAVGFQCLQSPSPQGGRLKSENYLQHACTCADALATLKPRFDEYVKTSQRIKDERAAKRRLLEVRE